MKWNAWIDNLLKLPLLDKPQLQAIGRQQKMVFCSYWKDEAQTLWRKECYLTL